MVKMYPVSDKKDHISNSRYGANTFGGGFPTSHLSTEKKLGKRRFPNEALSSGYGVGAALSPSTVDSNSPNSGSYSGRQQLKRDSPHSLSSTGSSTTSREGVPSRIPTLAAAGKPTVHSKEGPFGKSSTPGSSPAASSATSSLAQPTKPRPKRSPLAAAISSKKLSSTSSSSLSLAATSTTPAASAITLSVATDTATSKPKNVNTTTSTEAAVISSSSSSTSSSKSSMSHVNRQGTAESKVILPNEEQRRVTVNSNNLSMIMKKLDYALNSIRKNEVKMKELEQDNMMLREVNAKKLAELRYDNELLKEDIQDTNETLKEDIQRADHTLKESTSRRTATSSSDENMQRRGNQYSSHQYNPSNRREEYGSKLQDALTPNKMKIYLSIGNVDDSSSSNDYDELESGKDGRRLKRESPGSKNSTPTWDVIYSPESPTIRPQLSPMQVRRQTATISSPNSGGKKLNMFYGSSSTAAVSNMKSVTTNLNEKYESDDNLRSHYDDTKENFYKNFNLNNLIAFQYDDKANHHVSSVVVLGYLICLVCILFSIFVL